MTKRKNVDRAERVLPPPEAQQHLRPWPMQVLLVMGPPEGIDADEFEAALQIVETWDALVADRAIAAITPEKLIMGHATGAHGELSDRDAERIVCWFEWAARLPLGLPARLVEWIEDEQPIGSVEVLRRACRLWDRIRSERAKPPVAGLDTMPRHMLTIAPGYCVRSQIDARPANRLTGSFSPPAALLPRPTSSIPVGAQMRQSTPRPVARAHHADAPAYPSPSRLRR